jgi:hypothetical protein
MAAPENAEIACREDSDCPTGWVCNKTVELCIKPETVNKPPALDGAATLSPVLLKDASVAVLKFKSTQELSSDPKVTVMIGQDLGLLEFKDKNELEYSYTYTAKRGRDPQGVDCPITIELINKYGVKSGSIAAGSIKFDFLSPAISESAVTGSPATTGKTVAVEFNVNKTLKSDPVVSFGAIVDRMDRPAPFRIFVD